MWVGIYGWILKEVNGRFNVVLLLLQYACICSISLQQPPYIQPCGSQSSGNEPLQATPRRVQAHVPFRIGRRSRSPSRRRY